MIFGHAENFYALVVLNCLASSWPLAAIEELSDAAVPRFTLAVNESLAPLLLALRPANSFNLRIRGDVLTHARTTGIRRTSPSMVLAATMQVAAASSVDESLAPSWQARLDEVAGVKSWVDSVGGSTSSVVSKPSPACGEDQVGLYAVGDAKRGDDLLQIPLRLGLSAERCLRSPIGGYLLEFDPEMADYAYIALILLYEWALGAESELAAWLPSVWSPTTLKDLALLWGPEWIAEIEASTSAGAAERMDMIRRDFAWLQENVFESAPDVFSPALFNEAAYSQAVLLAISRQVIVPYGDDDIRPMVLPMLDLVNHDGGDPTATVDFLAAQSGGLLNFGQEVLEDCAVLKATQAVQAGQQLTINYGSSTAGELFLDYGFLEEYKAGITLTIGMMEDDWFYDDKEFTLEEHGLLPEEKWTLYAGNLGKDFLPEDMIAYARLKVLTQDEAFLLEAVFCSTIWTDHCQLPISRENEEAVYRDLESMFASRLEKFRGTTSTDMEEMDDSPVDSITYKLAALRYNERRICEGALRNIQLELNGLNSRSADYFYHARRQQALGLGQIETADDLEALKASVNKAGGRSYGPKDYKNW